MTTTAVVPFRLGFDVFESSEGLCLVWKGSAELPTPETLHDSLCHAAGFNKVALDLVMKGRLTGREFLEKNKDQFLWGDLVLQHGQEFTADEKQPWQLKRPWRCHENTWELIRGSGGEISYAEGLCLSPFGGLLHSWGVHRGRVIDTTWPAPHLNRYFGVVFDEKFMQGIGLHGGVFCRWDPVRDYLTSRKAL